MRRFNLKKIAIVLGISGVVIWGAGTSFAKIMDKNNLKNILKRTFMGLFFNIFF